MLKVSLESSNAYASEELLNKALKEVIHKTSEMKNEITLLADNDTKIYSVSLLQ